MVCEQVAGVGIRHERDVGQRVFARFCGPGFAVVSPRLSCVCSCAVMMLMLSIIFLCMATFVAAVNIVGVTAAWRRARRGAAPGASGYSCIPLFSLVFAVCAWALGRVTIGVWAFVPALLDPATWSLVLLPLGLLRTQAWKKRDKQ